MPQLLLLWIAVLVLLPSPVFPAKNSGLFSTLSLTRSLRCTFSTVIQGDWEGGRLSTSKDDNQSFVLHFDGIDLAKKKARLIGNLGADDVVVMLTPRSLTFLEMTPSGNLNFTTVFPSYRKGSQDFIAVTSRHLILDGIPDDYPFPSQHHGSCRTWEQPQ